VEELMIAIRPADWRDLEAITEIYNEAVLTTTGTFDTEPKTLDEQRSWFKHHGGKYPVVVAELNTVVIGWASLSRWSDRCAYTDTAELSLYVKQEYRRRGVGRKLMDAIVAEGRNAGLHSVLARIAEGNENSIRLHESVGFHVVGVMREVGRKFGQLLDVSLMQLVYDDTPGDTR
jgi:L-amino acid N-acyltransferase YncA